MSVIWPLMPIAAYCETTRMKKKLTQAFNPATFHNPNKPVFIIDTTQTGFGIKINPSGKAVYFAEKKVNGKTKRITIETLSLISLADAKQKAREWLASSCLPIVKKISLSSLINEYLKLKQFSRWTVRDYCNTTNYYPDCLVENITASQINEWYMKGESTPATTDRVYRQLNTLLNYAVKKGYIQSNSCSTLLNRYKPKTKSGYLEPVEQLGKFWLVLSEKKGVTADIIRMYLLTGMRRREIFQTELRELSGVKTLVISNTKNGTTHYIPTTSAMPLSLFEVNKKYWTKDCRKTITTICKEANVPVVTVHDLRRTVASLCAYLGVDLGSIKHLLNHSVKGDVTLSHYIQHRTDYLIPVMEKIELYYKGLH